MIALLLFSLVSVANVNKYVCIINDLGDNDPRAGLKVQIAVTDDKVLVLDENGVLRFTHLDLSWGTELYPKTFTGLGHPQGEHIRLTRELIEGEQTGKMLWLTKDKFPYHADFDCAVLENSPKK